MMSVINHPSRFRVGMRNLKTALSVLACIVLYRLIGRDGVFLAGVSAVICMQDTLEKSFDSAKNRIMGTFLGALTGMLLLYVGLLFPGADLSPLLATVGIVVFIALCNALHKQDSIVIGSVVLLAIVLEQNEATPFIYSVNRLVDTAVGLSAAIVVNRFIRKPEARPADSAEELSGGAEVEGQLKLEDPPDGGRA